jgi:hypothetical protein
MTIHMSTVWLQDACRRVHHKLQWVCFAMTGAVVSVERGGAGGRWTATEVMNTLHPGPLVGRVRLIPFGDGMLGLLRSSSGYQLTGMRG